MYLGIDIGSTYTKYVVLNENKSIVEYKKLKSPANQKEYFNNLLYELNQKYMIKTVTSCGYGRNNIESDYKVSELIALAKGVNEIDDNIHTVIDIGGQDSKAIIVDNGKIVDFIINDKCAAGAGMYLKMALDRLEIEYAELPPMLNDFNNILPMTTVCAVYAQTEIVTRIANGEDKEKVIKAAVDSILKQVKNLTLKLNIRDKITLSGGFSTIKNIKDRLSEYIGKRIVDIEYSEFLSALGCSLISFEKTK